MYTSDMERRDRSALVTAFVYLLITLFLVLFGAVYEHFSHGVYSFFMAYAFVFTLVGGVLPFFAMGLFGYSRYPALWIRNLYHCAIATLTTGSIVTGILDIYGTTNRLIFCYWIIGAGLLVVSIVLSIKNGGKETA